MRVGRLVGDDGLCASWFGNVDTLWWVGLTSPASNPTIKRANCSRAGNGGAIQVVSLHSRRYFQSPNPDGLGGTIFRPPRTIRTVQEPNRMAASPSALRAAPPANIGLLTTKTRRGICVPVDKSFLPMLLKESFWNESVKIANQL